MQLHPWGIVFDPDRINIWKIDASVKQKAGTFSSHWTNCKGTASHGPLRQFLIAEFTESKLEFSQNSSYLAILSHSAAEGF